MGVLSPVVAIVFSVLGMFGVSGPSLSAITMDLQSAATTTAKKAAAEPPRASAGAFRNPINTSADPTMVYFNNSYYLATTQGDRIRIWRSPSIATLLNAPAADVYIDPDATRNKQMWAPAMYRFETEAGPRWYIYYTASDGVDANHRMYVIESQGDDPMGPYTFKNKVFDFGQYAIDGEPFRHNGLLYFAWASPGRGQGGPAQIYVAPMNNPWTVSGQPVSRSRCRLRAAARRSERGRRSCTGTDGRS